MNSRTSTYQRGAQHQFERSIAADNTVEMNGKDSSEVWSTFLVARRARPLAVIRQIRTYIHTVRHLRLAQIFGRVRMRLVRPRPDERTCPPIRTISSSVWVVPAARRQSVIGPSRFRFLNVTRDLGDDGWDNISVAKLWRYNLHYFDDLNAVGAAARTEWHRALLARWVRENPPPGGTGWEPYPTSLRIVNWIKWALAGNELPVACSQSLAVQTRWLSRRLETHLLGNHLFANAKALVFAGVFFEGPEPAGWLRKGFEILRREIPEQILDDGGQFERSPMYHALALEDVLDLCNLGRLGSGAFLREWRDDLDELARRARDMQRWLQAMCHPDGEISFFNDAAIGIAPPPDELLAYSGRLGLEAEDAPAAGVVELLDSGYVRVSGAAACALLDVGPVGPDYLPGHAHADTLSFELSLGARRVLVNSGTAEYGTGPERLRQRGTAAHNTVTVEGENSSEVWSGFRVARRARPGPVSIRYTNGGTVVACSHDGYRRLKGKVEHTRTWILGQGSLVVDDALTGSFTRAEARFHLHPSVLLQGDAGPPADRLSLLLEDGSIVAVTVDGGSLRREATTWHPEFGASEPNACLVVEFSRPTVRTRFEWSPG